MRLIFLNSLFVLLITAGFDQGAIAQQPTPGTLDSTDEYYIYLPLDFSPDKKYPLLILLDPFSRKLSINNYASIGDSLRMIVTSSRKSRNFDPGSTYSSVRAIYQSLTGKGYVDSSAVILGGFSGGARAATSYAMDHPEIKAVIAIGAGLAERGNFGTGRKIPFAGIVGFRDMNFEEMLFLEDYLRKMNNPGLFLYYDGLHQWPPTDILATSVSWLLNQLAFHHNSGYGEKSIRAAFNQLDSGYYYHAFLMARQLSKIKFLESKADSLIGVVTSYTEFKNHQKQFEEALERERTYMDEFSLLFNKMIFSSSVATMEPFREMANKLKSMDKSRNRYLRLSAFRCRDLSWRLCAEYYGQFATQKNIDKANELAEISRFFQNFKIELKKH